MNKKAAAKNGATPKNPVANLEDGDDEGLALLIPDIQETTQLVQNAATGSDASSREEEELYPAERPVVYSIEEKYLELMKKLQFGKMQTFKIYYNFLHCVYISPGLHQHQNLQRPIQ